jgi:hypothetical protein
VAYLIICFCFGLAGGIIGRSKGSSFFLWFVIAAIVPFVGLLVAIFYRNENEEPLGACPTCGKVVPLYQAICTRCGTELEYPDPPEPVAAAQAD